jgi:hypothetical protein
MRSRKTLWLLVIALLATALVAVGCGSSDDKSSNDSTAAATPPATTAATPPPATTDTGGGDTSAPTDTSGGGGGASDPTIKAAVDACKQQIAAAPTLNDATKADLNKICEEITSSDPAQIKKVAKDVCTKIVDDSNLPNGSAKDQAKQACDAVGG